MHFRNKERITFDHLVSMKKAGETGLVKVLRHGQEVEFTIKLGPVCYFSLKFKPSGAKSKLIKAMHNKSLMMEDNKADLCRVIMIGSRLLWKYMWINWNWSRFLNFHYLLQG